MVPSTGSFAIGRPAPVKRGRKARVADAQGQRVAELEGEVERLVQAETIVEVQKSLGPVGSMNPQFLPSFTAEVVRNAPVIQICRTGSHTKALEYELAEQGYARGWCARCGHRPIKIMFKQYVGAQNIHVKSTTRPGLQCA